MDLLIDAQRAARQKPGLYKLPSENELACIAPGRHVKVQYGYKDVELKVLKIHDDGKISAKINSKGGVKRLKCGDVVIVSETNIIEIK